MQSTQLLINSRRKQYEPSNSKKAIILIYQGTQNFIFWLKDQFSPPQYIKIKLITRDGRPAANVGGLSVSCNMRKYRTNQSGFAQIYLKHKPQPANKNNRQAIIYINGIRATPILKPSHKTYTIAVRYDRNKRKICPIKPYYPPKKQAMAGLKMLFTALRKTL